MLNTTAALLLSLMVDSVAASPGLAGAQETRRYVFAYDAPNNTAMARPSRVGIIGVGDARLGTAPALLQSPFPAAQTYDFLSDLVAPSGIPRLGSVGGEVAAARSHLGTIPDALDYGPNRAMLDSIDDALASGRPLTTAERSFLDHELLEASYVGQGMTQEAAHALTLQTVPAASNYSPAVIQQFPDYFFDYWGISR